MATFWSHCIYLHVTLLKILAMPRDLWKIGYFTIISLKRLHDTIVSVYDIVVFPKFLCNLYFDLPFEFVFFNKVQVYLIFLRFAVYRKLQIFKIHALQKSCTFLWLLLAFRVQNVTKVQWKELALKRDKITAAITERLSVSGQFLIKEVMKISKSLEKQAELQRTKIARGRKVPRKARNFVNTDPVNSQSRTEKTSWWQT